MIWKTTSVGKVISWPLDRLLNSVETRRQLSRFLVVGSASVLVDLSAYRILATDAGLPLYVAKGISYLLGVGVGFVGNKWWTFRSSRRSVSEPLSYLALYAVTLLVNIGCNQAVLTILGTHATALAFFVATGLTTVLNFFGMRRFTFRQGIAAREQVMPGDSREREAQEAMSSISATIANPLRANYQSKAA